MICLSEEAITRSNSSSSAPIIPDSLSGVFMIKLRIGTPPVQVFGIADIGTDLTWIQCSSSSSNNNNNNIFDPKKSKTFRNISCGSDECGLLDETRCGEEEQPCDFLSYYGDDVTTVVSGEAAADTFTFDNNNIISSSNNSNNNDLAIFPEVVFGCGYKNEGKAIYTAVVGLGQGPSSIVRQFGGSKFSYCLTSSNVSAGSRIRFGGDAAVTAGPNVVSTPLKKAYSFDAPNYYVRLEGITVGDKRLQFVGGMTPTLKRMGNIVFDSRTASTMLPSEFYNQLESALVNAINGTSKRVPDPRRGPAGLCYAGAAPKDYPALTMHFEGADLTLPRESTFVEVVEKKGVVCLTFLPTSEFPAFGNIQQRNFLIGFDLQNRKIDFLPTDCAKVH
ncbi:hypothetical protein ABFX02_14G026300 [Erythranthe guttata]